MRVQLVLSVKSTRSCQHLPSIVLADSGTLILTFWSVLLQGQVEKLRMLSIVSLAHTRKVVPYATIKVALGMDNVRHLEDTIFDTIYSGLLQGKLDQRQEVLKVLLLLD